jgi:hypothetical protein
MSFHRSKILRYASYATEVIKNEGDLPVNNEFISFFNYLLS